MEQCFGMEWGLALRPRVKAARSSGVSRGSSASAALAWAGADTNATVCRWASSTLQPPLAATAERASSS